MTDPIIEWYEDPTDEAPLSSWDYGTVDAGTVSATKKFYIYNNKGDANASTATDVRYTTFDDEGGSEQEDVVADMWLEVMIVSDDGVPVPDPDGDFKPVGGATTANQKDLSAFDLENDSYLEIDTRVRIPASPPAGERRFVQRVEFKFT